MTIQLQIKPILLKYGVKKAAPFGSYATNQQNQNSDVDIIIESPKGMGIEFIGLKHELEDALNKKVDLLSYNGLDKYIGPYILESQRVIM